MSAALIGIDTNVVVRVLLKDDPAQHQKAVQLLRAPPDQEPLLVNVLVVQEAFWLFEKHLKMDQHVVRRSMFDFLSVNTDQMSDVLPLSAIWGALQSSHRDFADVLIASSNLEIGCSYTVTFDKTAARKVKGMEVLS